MTVCSGMADIAKSTHLKVCPHTFVYIYCVCLITIPSQISTDSFDLGLDGIVSALSTVGPYIDRCVYFEIMSKQLNWPQVDTNQVVEMDIQRKLDAPELNLEWVRLCK